MRGGAWLPGPRVALLRGAHAAAPAESGGAVSGGRKCWGAICCVPTARLKARVSLFGKSISPGVQACLLQALGRLQPWLGTWEQVTS